MLEEAFSALCMSKEHFFIFDRLYLVADVLYGDEKGVLFLIFASSFIWLEQFCPGRTFYFDDFYFTFLP